MSVFNKKSIEKLSKEAEEIVEKNFDKLSDDDKKEFCKLGVTLKLLLINLGY